MNAPIQTRRHEHVAVVILNAPPQNRIGLAMVDRLVELVNELEADRDVRAIVVGSAGERAFSVGADIREFGQGVAKMTLDGFLSQRHDLIDAIEGMSKPVIAAIRGLCLGGGLELALGCHFRLASDDAQFGLPEIDLGLIPAWGGTQRLVREIGRARALDIVLRGTKLSAPDALSMGLVHSVHEPDQLMDNAEELAHELAEKAPLAVAAILECTAQAMEVSLQEGLAAERRAVAKVAKSRDAAEGISAFLSKRKPTFRGQ